MSRGEWALRVCHCSFSRWHLCQLQWCSSFMPTKRVSSSACGSAAFLSVGSTRASYNAGVGCISFTPRECPQVTGSATVLSSWWHLCQLMLVQGASPSYQPTECPCVTEGQPLFFQSVALVCRLKCWCRVHYNFMPTKKVFLDTLSVVTALHVSLAETDLLYW